MNFSDEVKIQLDLEECPSFYQNYIDKCSEIDIIKGLIQGKVNFQNLMESIPVSKWTYAYAQDKWTIAEVVQHIIDTERIFCYRSLRFAREDQTPIPGFEQDDYVTYSYANEMTKEDLIESFTAVRQSSIVLFKSFTDKSLLNTGIANHHPISVRAMGYIISGHLKHHAQIIENRYI
ncbi:DinB family protein [Aquimarina sp. ERC-38]|uniref:DinB family protein n=1 Tax=Aquimarina sp. ERC-38 TaxID=2949996 RepID=UPI002245727B|nr:DinB family protein [Aquimarina sp. ERC-38]UZO79514.1 DinB family protein [Aquimarina sp. ERC-38]